MLRNLALLLVRHGVAALLLVLRRIVPRVDDGAVDEVRGRTWLRAVLIGEERVRAALRAEVNWWRDFYSSTPVPPPRHDDAQQQMPHKRGP